MVLGVIMVVGLLIVMVMVMMMVVEIDKLLIIDMPVKTLEQPCQSDCFRSAEREHQGEQCWSGDRETEPSVPGHR